MAELELTAQISLCTHESPGAVVLRDCLQLCMSSQKPMLHTSAEQGSLCLLSNSSPRHKQCQTGWSPGEGRFWILLCAANNELSRVAHVKERKSKQTVLTWKCFQVFLWLHSFLLSQSKQRWDELSHPAGYTSPWKTKQMLTGPVRTFKGGHKPTLPFLLLFPQFFGKV